MLEEVKVYKSWRGEGRGLILRRGLLRVYLRFGSRIIKVYFWFMMRVVFF